MKRVVACCLLVMWTMAGTSSCQKTEQKERPAAVAGSFYPGDAKQLASYVDELIGKAKNPELGGDVVAVVAPHAGYQYSGAVAAHSYAAVKGQDFKRVVLIGPSHFERFDFTSVYDGQSYASPLGKVMVDQEFARKLGKAARSIRYSSVGHEIHAQSEHSLEVELPFLQRALGDFKLVPVVMGDQSYEASRELGMALAKLLQNDHETLIVASSDLSHYHTYDDAEQKDRNLLNAITKGDFLTVSRNLDTNTWEACGGAPIVATMIAAQRLGAGAPKLLEYANSGDVTGDKTRVVGYAALVFLRGAETNASKHTLTDTEKMELLAIARKSVETAVREHKKYEPPAPSSETLKQELGAFVTLTKNGVLRGCIGYTSPIAPLYLAVRDVAAYAALQDPRFGPVRPDELNALEYEISVLSPFRRVLDAKTVRVGEDGLLIKRGEMSGVLLPQVPVEQHWDRLTFLEEASMKAGIPKDSWRDEGTEIFAFTATVFSDHEASPKKPKVKKP